MLLLVGASNAEAEWLEYSIRVNGDVYFYDPVTIKKKAPSSTFGIESV